MIKLITFLALFFSINAMAEDGIIMTNNVVCMSSNSLFSIIDDVDEKPALVMLNARSSTFDIVTPMVLYINKDTSSWTIVERVGEDLFCVLALGIEIRPYHSK